MAENIFLSWSGGKDSCLALEKLLYHGAFRPAGLFTVYNAETEKVNLHNVPISLIRAQADSLSLPLVALPLSAAASNAEYENAHLDFFKSCRENGIHHIAFGDIFLETIRAYRDALAEKADIHFYYPLWDMKPSQLSEEFIERGFKAVITAINAHLLETSFLGRRYNEEFVRDLPDGIDICGENGEFHSFVCDGPIFSAAIRYTLGEVFEVDYRPVVEMKMGFIDIS